MIILPLVHKKKLQSDIGDMYATVDQQCIGNGYFDADTFVNPFTKSQYCPSGYRPYNIARFCCSTRRFDVDKHLRSDKCDGTINVMICLNHV